MLLTYIILIIEYWIHPHPPLLRHPSHLMNMNNLSFVLAWNACVADDVERHPWVVIATDET
jgi:hypothetical protein